MLDRQVYANVLRAALLEWKDSVKEMVRETTPSTPLPRERKIVLIPGALSWPYTRMRDPKDKNRDPDIFYYVWGRDVWRGYTALDDNALPDIIIRLCAGQPRLILRVLRRIQAASAWCRARGEGRKRQAEEILRQQAQAVQALEAEAALAALK